MIYKHSRLIIIIIGFLIILPLLAVHAAGILATGEIYYPIESDMVLNNPFMGWAPSADGGPYEQPHHLVYINTTWRELEPVKGEYSFIDFEEKYNFKYWRENDISIILRLNMDFPTKDNHIDIPDWLFKEIGGDGTKYDLDYGKGFSPNYSNEILIKYHEKLIKAIAERYNNNPLVPIIALGSIGHWGEWHTKQGPDVYVPFPEVDICNRYIGHYVRFFTNKHLVIRRPFGSVKENKIGLYNDSFGDIQQTGYFVEGANKGYYDYLAGKEQESMPDYWLYAPSGGEIANPPGIACFDKENIKTTLKQVKECHTSWLGPSCPAYYNSGFELQKNYDTVLKTMGYRLVLESFRHKGKVKAEEKLDIRMLWENKGVAPFYYSWPLEISFSGKDSNIIFKTNLPEDIRTWLPGRKHLLSAITIPSNLKPGVYNICIAIINPETGEPAIDIAIEGRRDDGRYCLDEVVIIPNTP